jgi:glycerate dehydrogenase
MSRDELLAQADVIFLHTLLNSSTEGMINKETIAKMKDASSSSTTPAVS